MKFIHFVIPCWGDDYINKFEKSFYPNFIEYVKETDLPYKLIIYTDKKDLDKFPNADFIQKIDLDTNGGKWNIMTNMQAHGYKMAHDNEAAMFFCFPDEIQSKGVLKTCINAINKGYQCVYFPSFRSVIKIENLKIYTTPRELLALFKGNEHPMFLDMCYNTMHDKDALACPPYSLIFKEEDNYICHFFHPLYKLVIPKKDINFSGTIDFQIPEIYSKDEIYLVNDSDEGMIITMEPENYRFDFHVKNYKTCVEIMRNASSNGSLFKNNHKEFFRNPILVKSNDCDIDANKHKQIIDSILNITK